MAPFLAFGELHKQRALLQFPETYRQDAFFADKDKLVAWLTWSIKEFPNQTSADADKESITWREFLQNFSGKDPQTKSELMQQIYVAFRLRAQVFRNANLMKDAQEKLTDFLIGYKERLPVPDAFFVEVVRKMLLMIALQRKNLVHLRLQEERRTVVENDIWEGRQLTNGSIDSELEVFTLQDQARVRDQLKLIANSMVTAGGTTNDDSTPAQKKLKKSTQDEVKSTTSGNKKPGTKTDKDNSSTMPCFRQIMFNAMSDEKRRKEKQCDTATCTFNHQLEPFEIGRTFCLSSATKFGKKQSLENRKILNEAIEKSYETTLTDKKLDSLRIKNKED